MSCEWVAQHIDAYELGELRGPDRQRVEAHLASCQACRQLLESVRAADGAIRAALAWTAPRAGFAQGLAARQSRRARAWRVAAVAAAAVACAAVIYAVSTSPGRSPKPPDEPAAREWLLRGRLSDSYGFPVERMEPGRAYVAATHTAMDLDERSLFLLTQGTEFAAGPARRLAMSLLSGTVLGQVGRGQREMAVELAPELGGAIVRTNGCQFYSSGAPAHWLTRGLAVRGWPEEIRVHVFSGRLEVDLGAQQLVLSQGDSAIIAGGVSAGSTRALEARIEQLRSAIGEQVLARRRRYRQLRQHYARRVLELASAQGRDAPSDLGERLALVRGLARAHARGLARLEAERPEVFELDAAEAELERLDQLRETADEALERLVTLVSDAG
jgi:hypothetical protein